MDHGHTGDGVEPGAGADRVPLPCARRASGHGATAVGAPGAARGLDADESGNGTAAEQRLYQLIRQPKPIVDRTFAIEFLDAGVEAFTFG